MFQEKFWTHPTADRFLEDISVDFEAHWEDKCWGRVKHLFYSENCGVSYLEATAGWRCSIHRHSFRSNMFVVLDGEVDIEEFQQGNSGGTFPNLKRGIPSFVQTLTSGGVYEVRASTWHRFSVRACGQIVEVYRPDLGPVRFDDIIRFNEGGKIE